MSQLAPLWSPSVSTSDKASETSDAYTSGARKVLSIGTVIFNLKDKSLRH